MLLPKQKAEEKIIKFELLIAAEEILEKKSDIKELFKIIDQLRLFKKIILNENQCFMIENRELQNINYDNNKNSILKYNEMVEINKEKYELKKKKLLDYLKKHKEENTFSTIDKLLLNYVDQELKQEL